MIKCLYRRLFPLQANNDLLAAKLRQSLRDYDVLRGKVDDLKVLCKTKEDLLAEAQQQRDDACKSRAKMFDLSVSIISDCRQRVTQQKSTISQLAEALQWMSDRRASTIFIEEPEHVAHFFEKCDAALANVRTSGQHHY